MVVIFCETRMVSGKMTDKDVVVMDEIVDRDIVGKHIGQVKWFNDRLGYGFCTIVSNEMKGSDIFVHHSGIRPMNSNYKTLRKGEYVNFNLANGNHGPQAIDVTGVCGGTLMCDVMPIRRTFVPPHLPIPAPSRTPTPAPAPAPALVPDTKETEP